MARKYKPKSFESAGVSNDTSANIYRSMMISKAWKDLSPTQICLYLYCKSLYYGMPESKKVELFAQYIDLIAPTNVQCFFSLSQGTIIKDERLYTNKNQFYKDRDALILHGFIKVIADGRLAKNKTIYSFSDKWKLWGTDDFIINDNEKPLSLLKKRNKSSEN